MFLKPVLMATAAMAAALTWQSVAAQASAPVSREQRKAETAAANKAGELTPAGGGAAPVAKSTAKGSTKSREQRKAETAAANKAGELTPRGRRHGAGLEDGRDRLDEDARAGQGRNDGSQEEGRASPRRSIGASEPPAASARSRRIGKVEAELKKWSRQGSSRLAAARAVDQSRSSALVSGDRGAPSRGLALDRPGVRLPGVAKLPVGDAAHRVHPLDIAKRVRENAGLNRARAGQQAKEIGVDLFCCLIHRGLLGAGTV
jgi:hypothetical protein